MADVAFGIFDHIERRKDEPLTETYEGRLKMLEVADKAGFHCYHLAEHHGTPLSMAPSPGIFLAAVAQRTRSLHFGPLVYLLPLYNPLRLAQEICMLDQLSGGRMEIGVGRGVSPFELAYFNVPFLESEEIFNESLEVIVSALRNERVVHRGATYQIRGFPMALQPKQTPNPPFWYASTNPEKAEYAARRGMNLVGIGPATVLKSVNQRYREVFADRWQGSKSFNPNITEPKVGVLRHCYVAETDAEALEVARPAYRMFHDNLQQLWRDFNTVATQIIGDVEVAAKHGAAIVGSPATIREEAARYFDQSGCNYQVLSFAWGGLTQEQSMRSLGLFTSEVMPFFPRPSSR